MNTTAKLWARRVGGFFFVVLEICALGGLLGAIMFPVVGKLAGAHKSAAELIVLGVKTGAFFFLVWAPGAALVRMFMRAAQEKAERLKQGRAPAWRAETKSPTHQASSKGSSKS